MATVDELNFKIIVDDKDFEQQVQKDIATAKQLNTELSNLLNVKLQLNKISQQDVANARNANKIATDNVRNQEKQRKAIESTNIALNEQRALSQSAIDTRLVTDREKQAQAILKTALAQEKLNAAQSSGNRIMREATAMLASYFSIRGAVNLAKTLVNVTGEFEKQRVTLRAMLQDVQGADSLFEQIKQLAVYSPFTFKELASYAKQLAAYSVPVHELYDTTKMLADVSAGLGVGMDRMILAYGQVRSAAFLRGQEVRQFTEAGIPILDELAKKFSEIEGRLVSAGQVFDKISKRQVSFEMVAEVFKDMTSEGGKFYQMQEVQATTLQGKLSNLTDAYEIMFSEIGDKLNPVLKQMIDWVRSLAENYEENGRTLLTLITTYGAARVAIDLLAVATGKLAAEELLLSKASKGLLSVLTKNPYVAAAAGVALLVAGIVKLASETDNLTVIQETATGAVKDFNRDVETEAAKVRALCVQLKLAKEGTEEYEKVKKVLINQYGEYIRDLENEGYAVKDLADNYGLLVGKIRESMKERHKGAAFTQLDENFKNSMDEFEKKFDKSIKGIEKRNKKPLTEMEREILYRYMMGDIDELGIKDLIENQGLTELSAIFKELTRHTERFWAYNNIKTYRAQIEATTKAYSDQTLALEQVFNTLSKEGTKSTEELREEAKVVQEIMKKYGITGERGANGLWFDDGKTEHFKYVDDLRKRYGDVNKELDKAGTYQEEEKKALQDEKKMIEEIAKAIGVSLDSLKTRNALQKQVVRDEETQLKTEISTVQAVKRAYDKLREALPDDESRVKQYLMGLFPDEKDLIEAGNFTDTLETLALQMERFGEEGKKFAESVRNGIGGDAVDMFVDKVKLYQKYDKSLKDFLKNTPIDAEGEGVYFDIDKIVKNYANELAELQKKKEEKYKEAEARAKASFAINGVNGDAKRDEYTTKADIDKFIANSTTMALGEAKKALAKLADDWVKGQDSISQFDLSNWSQMTVNQVADVKKALQSLLDEGLPDELKEQFKNSPELLDSFGNAVQNVIKTLLGKANKQGEKKNLDLLKDAASAISNLSRSLEEYGNASGNVVVKSLSADLAFLAESAEAVVAGFVSGNWLGAAVAGISVLVEGMIKAATAAAEFQNRIAEAQRELRLLNEEARLASDVENLFGTNSMQSMFNAINMMDEYEKKVRSNVDAVNEMFTITKNGGFFGESSISWRRLSSMMSELGDLYDQNGYLNVETLKKVLEVYGEEMSKSERDKLQEYIDNLDLYYKATEQFEKETQALFGNLASSLADDMLNSFLEIGDATADLGDSFTELGRTIAKSFLESFLLKNVLNQYEDEVNGLIEQFYQNGDVTALSNGLVTVVNLIQSNIQAMAPAFNSALSAIQSTLGLGESSGSNTLGAGIKGITEDTASLLASYINAIRADVAMGRVQRDTMIELLRGMSGTSATPNLAEYLVQIQAYTLRTAEASESILSEMRSAMSYNGDIGFRVFSI